MRFHVLGLPHTVTTPEYSSCAFTMKVLKLCRMLKLRGHTVIHYGHEDSQVAADEQVSVTSNADLEESYPNHDWRKQGWPSFRLDDAVYKKFFARTITALHLRKLPGDILCCPFGEGHKPVYLAHPDMIACETGIGYPAGGFAPYRVFESYAMLHAHYGMAWVQSMSNAHWYDVVIPNAFDTEDFTFSAEKDDYFLFLGRVGPGKGTHIAVQIAEALDSKLIIAGAGGLNGSEPRTARPVTEYVELVGVVGPEQRRHLLSRAKALLAPSTYLEPFCGVQIEAMLSGTPVISTDFGAFAEYNIHGVTGYRCRTFEQFVWAGRNIAQIQPQHCHMYGEANFSLERVADLYDEYFWAVSKVHSGQGWYQTNPLRVDLGWLNRVVPPVFPH